LPPNASPEDTERYTKARELSERLITSSQFDPE